ncbi:hypothetical protein RvY_06524 [Ramazzottius varieornatus]|uniref:Zyxin n=1 Tax=Ramazzottius varieornatus TaxID=947166 RepID=A0A1D1V4C5_RAMVA|nr:hypothetical protein RvY_06524 [Ramazzottius varieornatus]
MPPSVTRQNATASSVVNDEPTPASFAIIRTKQANSFPIYLQRPVEQRPPPELPINGLYRSNQDHQPTMVSGSSTSVQMRTKTTTTSRSNSRTAEEKQEFRKSLSGDEKDGLVYEYYDVHTWTPSPTPHHAEDSLERNIERWEKERRTRRSMYPESVSSLHGNIQKVQKISDLRTLYHRNTPQIGPVSSPPSGTKKKPLDNSVFQTESEVNNLTNLLVTKMNIPLDPNSYGLCTKCLRSVHFEDEGCTALDQLYHTNCFTCNQCGKPLRGGSFYNIEGKIVCEADYMNTLEKCTSCKKPISERILRATGKPYHPQCFVCVGCETNLDGVPFTVDAANQIYCIKDFHAKFAPRCSVCRQPIAPREGTEEAVRVISMERNFHPQCYKCEDCGLTLHSDQEGHGCYPLDGHVLCHACNIKRSNAAL